MANDPVNAFDPTGTVLETLLDVVSVGLSLWDLIKCPTWANVGWLGADVLGAVVPFLPALGTVRRAAKFGALQDASDAALSAARSPIKISRKHLPNASGNYAKFADGVDMDATVREALRSPNAQFRPNRNRDGELIPGYRVYTDLGREIGSRGETGLRTIVSPDGRVITSFPAQPWN